MIYLINKNTDPAINHAIEEYFLKETNEDVFTLWRNKPTVLLGTNQDAYSELDIEYANKNDIKIVRRLSGGGAVYCDLNNMQYSFITDMERRPSVNQFEIFAMPVVESLKKLGLDAEFTGRNDIIIEGKKISGNAQYRYKDRILHHGTLLFDADMDKLASVLKSRPLKFKGKAVKSVSSRIGRISDYVDDMNVVDFMDYLSRSIIDFYGISELVEVDEEILNSSEKYLEKFKDPVRNLGANISEYNEYRIKYPFGLIEYKIKTIDGLIEDINIYGDFFSDEDIISLRSRLIGRKLDRGELRIAIDEIEISNYINGMTNEDFISDLVDMNKGA
ncbi:MAG: lipoate--protein ligase [Tissierellia bacterium]|nr:lipoate--protein ligase [Tissierellia bacterium]